MHKNTWLYAGIALLIVALMGVGVYAYATRPLEGRNADLAAISAELAAMPTASGATLESFTIDATRSKASFSIFEVLHGQPKTVIGATDQIAGTITIDKSNPAQSMSSEILVSARTLKTDASARDNTIARYILKSEDLKNEFLRFKPNKMEGLPSTGTVGQAYPLTITGDMTIAGMTKPMTFDATVTYTTSNELHVTAQGKLMRGDYNIIIPSVAFVADVGEEVTIDLDFMAKRSS